MNFTDAVTISGTKRTNDGYLVVTARAVRTGVQVYLGDEVGRSDLTTVNVYRPDTSVFDQASLQSFTHAPITLDHPADGVTADNWKELAVGEVSTAAQRDGEWIALPLILKDAKAISAVEGGKRELSAGYTCELVWGGGITADGTPYQATQTQIKINHLAIVDRARAGNKARIGDGAVSWGATPVNIEDKQMTLKTVTVDGIPVEVTDAGATVIATMQARIADATAKAATADAAHATVIAAKDAELAKKDAEIDALKAKVMDAAALDAAVQARGDLVATAKALVPTLEVKGLSDAAIRKAVVTAKLGDADLVGKADAYIDARFEILAEDAGKTQDTFAAVVAAGFVQTADAATEAAKARADYIKSLSDGWKANPTGTH